MSTLYKYNNKAIDRSLSAGFILQDFMSLWCQSYNMLTSQVGSYFIKNQKSITKGVTFCWGVALMACSFLVFNLVVSSSMLNASDYFIVGDDGISRDVCYSGIGSFFVSCCNGTELLKNYALGKSGAVVYMPYYKYPLTAPVTKEAFLWAHQCDVTTMYPGRTWVEWFYQLFMSPTPWSPSPIKTPTMANAAEFFECSINAVCGPDGNFLFINTLPNVPHHANALPAVLLELLETLDVASLDLTVSAASLTYAAFSLCQHNFGFTHCMSILHQVMDQAGLFMVTDPITNTFSHYSITLTPEGAKSLVAWDNENLKINLATKDVVPETMAKFMQPGGVEHSNWYVDNYENSNPFKQKKRWWVRTILESSNYVPWRYRNHIYVGASLLQPQAGIKYQVVFINNLTGLPFRPDAAV